MVKTKIYHPKKSKSNEKMPAVLGMPGFVGTLKDGRIEQLLKSLSRSGIFGLGMTYTGIEKKGKKVICNFNMKEYLEDVKEAFKILHDDPRIDNERIGVITSSISGVIFSHAIGTKYTNKIAPIAYVAISPLMGWEYFGSPEQRQGLKKAIEAKTIEELEITSVYDARKGIKRVIPIESLKNIQKINGITELNEKKPQGLEILTLIGELDERASPNSMEIAHYTFGGKPENILKFPTGHTIPSKNIKGPIIEFLKQTLKGKPQN